MAKKKYSKFSKATELEPHYQMLFSVIYMTLVVWSDLAVCYKIRYITPLAKNPICK